MLKHKLERAEKTEASRLSGIPERSDGFESLKEKEEEDVADDNELSP